MSDTEEMSRLIRAALYPVEDTAQQEPPPAVVPSFDGGSRTPAL